MDSHTDHDGLLLAITEEVERALAADILGNRRAANYHARQVMWLIEQARQGDSDLPAPPPAEARA